MLEILAEIRRKMRQGKQILEIAKGKLREKREDPVERRAWVADERKAHRYVRGPFRVAGDCGDVFRWKRGAGQRLENLRFGEERIFQRERHDGDIGVGAAQQCFGRPAERSVSGSAARAPWISNLRQEFCGCPLRMKQSAQMSRSQQTGDHSPATLAAVPPMVYAHQNHVP